MNVSCNWVDLFRSVQFSSCVVNSRERKCADTIGTVLVRWAGHFQYWNIKSFFSNKIYLSNFIKQHSETVMVWNYRNADCSFRKKYIYCVMYCSIRRTFVRSPFLAALLVVAGGKSAVTWSRGQVRAAAIVAKRRRASDVIRQQSDVRRCGTVCPHRPRRRRNE